MNWWSLLRRRARWAPGLAAGVVAVLALTALLVTTVAVAGPAVVAASLRDRLAAAPPDQRGVEVSAQWDRSAPGPQDAAARRLLLGALAPLPVHVESVREGELLPLPGGTDRLVPWAGAAVQSHAGLTAGRWPAGSTSTPLEAALHAGAAAALGIHVGDVLHLGAAGGSGPAPPPVVVVGLWTPRDPGDGFWRGQPLALQGLQREGVRGPLVVDEAGAARLRVDWTARWRAVPALGDVTPELLEPLAASVAGLRGVVGGALPAGSGPTPGAETAMSDLLAGLAAPVRAATGAVRTLLVLLAAAAAALCLLVGSTVAQVRARDDAVLRARGAGAVPRLLFGLREGAVWALAASVPVAVLAPAAVSLTGAGGTAAGPSARAIVPAAVAWTAVVGLLLVAVVALAARAVHRGARGRPGEALPVRPPTLLVVALAGAAAAWQLRSAHGTPDESPVGIRPDDPVLVVAVAVLLVSASVLVVVALAALARPVARLAGRAGPVGALAGWHAGRRGLQPVTAVVVVVLCGAGAVCLLAGRQAGRDAAVAQAHRQVAPVAAVNVPVPPGTPVEAGAAEGLAAGRRLAALPGVSAVSPVLSIDGSVGSSGAVRVLAVDRDLLARLAAGAQPAAVPPASAALLGNHTGDPRSLSVSAVLSAPLAATLTCRRASRSMSRTSPAASSGSSSPGSHRRSPRTRSGPTGRRSPWSTAPTCCGPKRRSQRHPLRARTSRSRSGRCPPAPRGSGGCCPPPARIRLSSPPRRWQRSGRRQDRELHRQAARRRR